MKIKYPEIVEDFYNELHSIKPEATIQQAYEFMIDNNFIDENCQPTQWALDQGYVVMHPQNSPAVPDNSLKAYKRDNPQLAEFDDSYFQYVDGLGWMIDPYVVKALCNEVLLAPNATAEDKEAARDLLKHVNEMGH